MNKENELRESKEKSKRPLSFHERFDIEVNLDTAKERFINRIFNFIDDLFSWLDKTGQRGDTEHGIMRFLARNLGLRYGQGDCLSNYVHMDFTECLRCIEALYQAFELFDDTKGKEDLTFLVSDALSMSEVNLGIEWKNGIFSKSGAKLLDVALVNENLEWLSEPKYANVLAPFEKGLRHFLEAASQPERLADSITDMYEAVEALAKTVTGRPDKDLSANAELFVSKLQLSKYYDKMLKDYINYANEYRHALKPGETRKLPVLNEVEAFVYTTGLFIRLAVQQLNQ